MEGKDEALKQIESLKKLLLHEESSEKSNSEEICSLFVELSKSSSHKDHKSGSHVISSTIEILVHGCSNHSHVVRGVAAENLKKFVKKLMGTNFSRIQQDLFHELKKNGDCRSVCVALDCFSFLFPLTRPSRCSLYAQSLVPVLLRLLSRHEDSVHEVLQDALQKIVPTLAPFMTIHNLKAIVNKILVNLVSEAPSYRRMASTVFTDIGKYSKKSFNLTQWLIKKLLDFGSGRSTCLTLINAVLIILQHFFSSASEVPFSLLKQAYNYVISCIVYRDQNTIVSGLECLHHLLNYSNSEFVLWLTSPLDNAQVAVDLWCSDGAETVEASDSTSLQEELDAPKDNYFESDKNSSNPSLSGSVQDLPSPDISSSELFCMATRDDVPIPLDNLTEYLLSSILTSHRVSIQSLGLACITCAVDMKPTSLKSLDAIVAFVEAHDPKLRSNAAKLLAVNIRSNLRILGGRVEPGPSVISISYEHLFDLIEDETPIVMKSVCEALRLCLPTMLYSTMYNLVLEVLKKLLPLSESSYWLTKTELLETVGCLDFTILAMQDKKLPGKILHSLVFKLLGDNDYRVRASACECLVSLASNMTLDENLLLAHIKKKSELLFSHLRCSNTAFSFAGITHMLSKKVVLPPIGMEHIIWHLLGGLSSSEKPLFQRGCLEALHLLSLRFPPSALPEQWGCLNDPFTHIEMMNQLLKSSRLAWMVQTHCALLEFSSSIFLSCGLFNMKKADKTWALGDDSLVQFANYFLVHNVKLLCLFVHIIEEREPEHREKKMIQLGVSPKKQTSDAVSPNKSKPAKLLHSPTQLLPESLTSSKPPLVAKDGIGHFVNSLHFMRLFEACKAAYSNFQVSLGSPGTDNFSKLLLICHKSLATLLEMALASDIGKYVEEILVYLTCTVKVDSSGALLCVQQLLNALFGMNTVAQQTHLYTPFVSSLTYNIGNTARNDGDGSLYSCLVEEPIKMMKKWLNCSSLYSTHILEGRRRSSIVPLKKALTMRPINSVSDIKDYIAYFEPLVVYALNLFPYTSSILFQQRALILVVQLLYLKVRYDLLDCHHSFYETVLKLTGLMESGMVKGGEALVPYLFQFLVLLSSDQSKLVTIPQVMQMCDGVMASGHNVTTFAVPALQPLVLNLFVRSTHLSADIEAQREVAVNMLLKLVKHSRVIMLLTHVLDHYKEKQSRWNEVSSQIYCAMLPCIENLQIVLDIKEAFIALYHLFMAMDPETFDLHGLLSALLKQTWIGSSSCLLRWLSLVCLLLELMGSVFSDSSLLNIRTLEFVVPGFSCPLINVSKLDLPTTSSNDHFSMASFLTGALRLGANCLYQVCIQNCGDDYELLPSLVANMLLLLRILPDRYPMLKQGFSELTGYEELSGLFLNLSTFFPLLALHYLNFVLLVDSEAVCWMAEKVFVPCDNPISKLLQQGALASVCSQGSGSLPLLRLLIMSPSWHQSEVALTYLSCAKQDLEIHTFLKDNMKISGEEEASQLLHYLYILSQSLSPSTLDTLCCNMVVHPLSVIGQTSGGVVSKYLQDHGSAISKELAEELIQGLKLHNQWASPDLISKLCRICGQPPSRVGALEGPYVGGKCTHMFNKEWYIKKITEFCSSGMIQDNGRRVHMLSNIEKDDLDTIFGEATITMSLLESCIVHGIRLTLNSRTSLQHFSSGQPGSPPISSFDYMHPLLEVSIKEVVSKLKQRPLEDGLIRCCVRLLAASHQFRNGIFQDADVLDSLRDFSLQAFMKSCSDTDPLAIQNSMDCCTLVLHLPTIQRSISEQWARNAVNSLCNLIPKVLKNLPKTKPGSASVHQSNSELTDLEYVKQKLLSVLSAILNREVVSVSPTFQCTLEMFTFTLCRLPIWHGLVITPPVLKKEGIISDNLLDEALKECEVLLEFMQRCNSLGWLTRAQFEERWMQLLGVINQPLPIADASTEEYHAHYINVCAGLRAITSLLCCTMLLPSMGDPTSSVLMHLHRNNEMIFLESRPGRKFLNVRKRLELDILSECGVRANVYDYYQSPLLSHYSSSCYPPLYSKNLEREIGATTIGYGQLPMRSLWPIVLKQKSSCSFHSSDSEEVDVKSCILSLVDLYMHWLTQPVNALLLNHVLGSVIMLSDLFAASDQFEWMLRTLLDLYECHPYEDVSTVALLVVGIMKTTTVLKASHTDSERQIKIIEKSLTSETVIQYACLQGILYLSEDLNNNILPNCIPSITKYILNCFRDFLCYSEDHMMILWSITVVFIIDYSQYIKDQSFVSRTLDVVIQLMNKPNISTSLFHSLALGLEFLVLNFSLSTHEKASVLYFATNRFIKSDRSKSLATLSLLLVCMYTGVEADVASGLVEESSISTETAIQAREQVNNLMEKLRHGSEVYIGILVDILPQIITEFLSPMEVLQTVVTDFISPHQSRPQMSAAIMSETFLLLLKSGHQSILNEWILLSLESFVQQEPESRAVWSITCLFLAASTTDTYRSMFPLVCHWKHFSDSEALQLLCIATESFYIGQCDQEKQSHIRMKFKNSNYPSLIQVAEYYCV